ncbi:putative quinol monooxygenase [Geodermatophilus sp. URMC 62]|uniref:putative quinol monooxygenase n=1 Tax=Geodermatophilus sp. URMC 62 TaxID=3423414 RepID=UPI00406C62F3
MLVVIGNATAAPGRCDELVAAARVVAAATRGDDGCLAYTFAADVEDPDRILGVEVWRDAVTAPASVRQNRIDSPQIVRANSSRPISRP